MEKERRRFVTLFFKIFFGLHLSAAAFIVFYNHFRESIVDFLLLSICCVAIFLILKWKPVGFWLYVGTNLLALPYYFLTNFDTSRYNKLDLLAFFLIGLSPSIILFGILQIRKKGISSWEYLISSNSMQDKINITVLDSFLLKDDNLDVFLSSIYKSCITENKEEPKEIDLINKYGENIYPIVSSWAISAYKGGEISPENRKLIMGNIKKNLDYYEDIFNKVKTLIIAGLNNGQ